MANTLHIHFGAGRLGLGLVVPILVRRQKELHGARFAVFQRPNRDEWRVVAKSQHLKLVINGQLITRFTCVTDYFTGELSKLLERGNDNDEPLFVSTSRLDLLTALMRHATSFSTAVGASGLGAVEQGLALRSPSKSGELSKLYAFENDEAAVQKLAVSTAQVLAKVIPVSSDRICIERNILADRLELSCEHFPGAAVLYDSPKPLPGFVSVQHSPNAPSVLNTETEADKKFYTRRKFLLVNGMHTVMAVWVYGDLLQRGVDRCKWPQADIRLWWRSSSQLRGRQLALLLSARVLQLLHDVPRDVLQRVIGTTNILEAHRTTLAYAHIVVQRILAQYDHVGRILDLNDEKTLRSKLASRFYDLRDFIGSKAHVYCRQRRLRAMQILVDEIHTTIEAIRASSGSSAVADLA